MAHGTRWVSDRVWEGAIFTLGAFVAVAMALEVPRSAVESVEQAPVALRAVSPGSVGVGIEGVLRAQGVGPALTIALPWSGSQVWYRPRVGVAYFSNAWDPARQARATSATFAGDFGLEISHRALRYRTLSFALFVSAVPEIWLWPSVAISGHERQWRFHLNTGFVAMLQLQPIELVMTAGLDAFSLGARLWF